MSLPLPSTSACSTQHLPALAFVFAIALLAASCGAAPPEPPSTLQPATTPADAAPTNVPTAIPAAQLPTLSDEQLEFHGEFAGGPIWARLTPPRSDLGGHRVLMLLYETPPESRRGQAQMADHPWLLLDTQLRLRFWDERGTLTRAQYRSDQVPQGYIIAREVISGTGTEAWSEEVIDPVLATPPGWELRSAPILLALVWRAGSNGEVPLIDLFGPRRDETLRLSWQDRVVTCAGEIWQIEADDDGLLKQVLDPAGQPLLRITARQAPLPADEALEREAAYQRRLAE